MPAGSAAAAPAAAQLGSRSRSTGRAARRSRSTGRGKREPNVPAVFGSSTDRQLVATESAGSVPRLPQIGRRPRPPALPREQPQRRVVASPKRAASPRDSYTPAQGKRGRGKPADDAVMERLRRQYPGDELVERPELVISALRADIRRLGALLNQVLGLEQQAEERAEALVAKIVKKDAALRALKVTLREKDADAELKAEELAGKDHLIDALVDGGSLEGAQAKIDQVLTTTQRRLATTQKQLSESQAQARDLQNEASALKQEMAVKAVEQKHKVDQLAFELEQLTKESDAALAKASRQIRLKAARLKTADDEARDSQRQVAALRAQVDSEGTAATASKRVFRSRFARRVRWPKRTRPRSRS